MVEPSGPLLEPAAERKQPAPITPGIVGAVARLDLLFARAIEAARAAYGPEAGRDAFRGLYLDQAQVDRLLLRRPGEPVLRCGESAAMPAIAIDASPRLAWLAQTYRLSAFEVDVLLLALAPELDLRYERLIGYLEDDVSRRRPSIDLALNLLCASGSEKLAARACFGAEAPLVHGGLVHLDPPTDRPHAPLLAHAIRLDDQIVSLLLEQDGLDRRLAPFAQLMLPGADIVTATLAVPPAVWSDLLAAAITARSNGDPLAVVLHEANGTDDGALDKLGIATALAGRLQQPLLVMDGEALLASPLSWREALRLLRREAWFRDAVLYLARADAIAGEGRQLSTVLRETLQDHRGLTLVGTPDARGAPIETDVEVLVVAIGALALEQRRECWRIALASNGCPLGESALDALAGRFRLLPAEMGAAVTSACRAARRRSTDGMPGLRDLAEAVRARSGDALGALARRIEPRYTWSDLELPADQLSQLHELCGRVDGGPRVLSDWGFDRRLSAGKGATALFAGPSGTGKSMAAEVVANELALDLYRIELASLVSKYIGETEKNLDRVFRAAAGANAVLLFDEADALFGKRSEVRDAHDRYANLEISYLLQKMEEYEGVAVLATNLRQHLDEAFVRRLAFAVHFPFPDEARRRRIWERVWPTETPLADDVDFDQLAARFTLSGGNIKNVALAAAFLAVDDGRVSMRHIQLAIRREYQKMGKTVSDAELLGQIGEHALNGRTV